MYSGAGSHPKMHVSIFASWYRVDVVHEFVHVLIMAMATCPDARRMMPFTGSQSKTKSAPITFSKVRQIDSSSKGSRG